MRAAVVLAVLAAVLSACGSNDETTSLSVVAGGANRCAATSDCDSGATCDPALGACLTTIPADLNVVYVMSFPSTSVVAAGQTVARKRSELFSCRRATNTCRNCVCIAVGTPLVRQMTGSYEVDGVTGQTVGLDIRSPRASLPVRATFRPYVPFETSFNLAATSRVPLLAVTADAARRGDLVAIRAPNGPGNTPPLGFTALLQEGDYVRTIDPLPPFDYNFPPVLSTFTFESPTGRQFASSTSDPSVRVPQPVAYKAQNQFLLVGEEDLSGWRVYLRDRVTKLRVSNYFRTTLGANDVKFFTVGYEDLVATPIDVVVEPPVDRKTLPRYVSEITVILTNELVPRLPAAVRFGGTIVGDNDLPLAATLVLDSVVTDDGISRLEPIGNKLRYSTELTTATDGSFGAEVPPGEYTLTVVPAIESGYAITRIKLSLSVGTNAEGRGFRLERPQTIHGSVTRLGAPAPGVRVRATAARELADVRTFARTRVTMTREDGTYDLSVDPGVYDVIVEPEQGARLAATIVQNIEVPAAETAPKNVDPIALEAPLDLGFTLSDNRTNLPVSGVEVRAFALPAGRNFPVELARGTTDPSGRVDLYAAIPR